MDFAAPLKLRRGTHSGKYCSKVCTKWIKVRFIIIWRRNHSHISALRTGSSSIKMMQNLQLVRIELSTLQNFLHLAPRTTYFDAHVPHWFCWTNLEIGLLFFWSHLPIVCQNVSYPELNLFHKICSAIFQLHYGLVTLPPIELDCHILLQPASHSQKIISTWLLFVSTVIH